ARQLRFAERLEDFFADEPPYAFEGYRAALWAIERGAILRKLRPLSRLAPEKRLAYLQYPPQGGDPPLLQSLQGFLSILKIVRSGQEDVYESMRYRRERSRNPGDKVPKGTFGGSVREGRAILEDLVLEADVVVVGTGAGGAVVGKELLERGRRVLFLEEGD